MVQEAQMASEKQEGGRKSRGSIRVELSPQQQEALKEMGMEGAVDFVEIDVEQLEDRIVPGCLLQ